MQKFFTVPDRIRIVISFTLVWSIQMLSFSVFGQLNNNQHKIRTIVIDAGHGGKDSGARGKNSNEKDIVLAISLKAGKYIEDKLPDVKVIYTRSDDTFIPLHERSRIANKANADLFISIHANSNPNTKAYGSETFAMGLHKSDENLEVAKKENSVIVYEDNYESKYEGFDPDDVESYIMLSLMQDTYLEQSLNAASFVQTQFRERVKRKDRGVKQAGFLVLWETSMPSILIEVGFVSNLNEEKYITSEQGQDYLASAIFRAFRDYKAYIEGSPSIEQENVASQESLLPVVEELPTETEIATTTVLINNNLDNKPDTTIPDAAINKVDKLAYKVQILNSAQPLNLNDTLFTDFNDVQEIPADGKYKYVVGSKDNYNEAVEYSKWVKSRYPDAFVVAVSSGKIIPLSEALEQN